MATKTATKTKAKTTQAEKAPKLGKYFYALGRRKTASATVRLFDEKGVSTVNDKPLEEVYPHQHEQVQILEPLQVVGLDASKFHMTVKVQGSGTKGQLGAIRLGLARALVVMDPAYKKDLKSKGLLTRDPRMVERKKPGLRKARRAEQFSKR